jgi:anti-anti-sigma regulatory factor
MPEALVLPDSLDSLPPPFACSWTNGGLDAGWVQVAGELDIATAPQLERTLRELQSGTHLVCSTCASSSSSTVPACTRSSTPASAPGRPATGWCSCTAPRTSIARSRWPESRMRSRSVTSSRRRIDVPTRSLSQSASAGREGRRSARLAASARSCLRCVAHDLGRVFHVAFAGTLDIATTLQADRTLRATQADAQLVILDPRQVKFIGSTARVWPGWPMPARAAPAADWWSSQRRRRPRAPLRSRDSTVGLGSSSSALVRAARGSRHDRPARQAVGRTYSASRQSASRDARSGPGSAGVSASPADSASSCSRAWSPPRN